MVKPAAGSTPLAYSSPEAVQTTGTVATPKLIAALVDVETTGTNLARDRVRRVALTLGCQPADDPVTTAAAWDRKFADSPLEGTEIRTISPATRPTFQSPP